MVKEKFSRKFEEQTPQDKALITAFANVYRGGDVEGVWAEILARLDARQNAPSAPAPTEALVQMRFHQ